jgi:hypothetical protein
MVVGQGGQLLGKPVRVVIAHCAMLMVQAL